MKRIRRVEMTFQMIWCPGKSTAARTPGITITAISEWSDRQLYAHAWICQRAFADTLDAQLFSR